MFAYSKPILILLSICISVAAQAEGFKPAEDNKVVYHRNDGRSIVVNPATPIAHVLEIGDVVLLVGTDGSLRVTTRSTIEDSFPQPRRKSAKAAVSTGVACSALAGLGDAFCFFVSKGTYIPGLLTAAAFVIPAAMTYALQSSAAGEVFHNVEGINIAPRSQRTDYRKLEMAHYFEGKDGRPDLRLTFLDYRGDIDQVLLSQLVQQSGRYQLEFNFKNLDLFFDFQTGNRQTKYIYDGCESFLRPAAATASIGN